LPETNSLSIFVVCNTFILLQEIIVCRIKTKALIMAILTRIALSLFNTLANMATPCSMKANGGAGLYLTVSGSLSQLVISFLHSAFESNIRKSFGNHKSYYESILLIP